MSQISFSRPQKKRSFNDENPTTTKKRLKNALDLTTHWKTIEKFYDNDPRKIFTCKSKDEYLIVRDPLETDRSKFVIAKSSFYWLNESIRQMQNHVVYGCTIDAAINGEIVEIERNLKALKINVEKNGRTKTFFHRAESLIHFVRFSSIYFGEINEKYHRRIRHLFNLCANGWLHMFDVVLPSTIVRVRQSFLLDDDFEDFEQRSILTHYRKDEQTKMKKTNVEFPNLRQLIYSVVNFIEKCEENSLIDRVYLDRFRSIYEIWIRIDNELNSRPTIVRPSSSSSSAKIEEKISWNFLSECENYEKLFGEFVHHGK